MIDVDPGASAGIGAKIIGTPRLQDRRRARAHRREHL